MGVLRRLVAAGCATTVLWFAGCQTDEVDPNASLSALEEQLYQDAFEAYSKYFEILFQLDQQGGAETLPQEIEQYVMGPELEWTFKAMHNAWALGVRYAGTNVNRIEGWQRADLEPNPETFLAIDVCRYHEATDSLNADGTLRAAASTSTTTANVQFAKDDGVIKVYHVETERVEECPF